MKYYSWFFSVALMLLITFISYDDDWCYTFGIHRSGCLVGGIALEDRNQGLTGFSVHHIDADPIHPGHVVIQSDIGDAYASIDHGASWRRLENHYYLWADKMLVRSGVSSIIYSADFGRNWLPLVESKGSDSLDLRRDSRGRAWVLYFRADGLYFYPIERTQTGLGLGQESSSRLEDNYIQEKVPVLGGELRSNIVGAPDGHWAGTRRGPFFRAAGNKTWEERIGNLNSPLMAEIVSSPLDPNINLARSYDGRLWTTKDRGMHWKSVAIGQVEMATYLSDGTLMVAQSNHKIRLFRVGEATDISPPDYYFIDSARRQLKDKENASHFMKISDVRRFFPEDFKFFAIGGTDQQSWIVAGDANFYEDPPAVARTVSQRIAEAIKGREEERSRLFLFVRETEDGWQIKSIDDLPRYETVYDNTCTLSVEGNELYLDDEVVPTRLLSGAVVRAGWLQDNSLYYAMSGSRVQVGKVRNCRQSGVARAWKLDGISVTPFSQVYEIPGGFEVLTPHGAGIAAFQVRLGHPPIWRWLLQHLAFGPGFAIAWGLLAAWRWWIHLDYVKIDGSNSY